MSDFSIKSFIEDARREHAAGTLSQWKVNRLDKIPGFSWGIGHGLPSSELELAARDNRVLNVMTTCAWQTANTIATLAAIPVVQVRKSLNRLLKSNTVIKAEHHTRFDISIVWQKVA
jgi:hypothetical protein